MAMGTLYNESMLNMNASATDHAEDWETVNRVVYPIKDQDLTLPLYVIEWTRPHLTDAVFDPRVDMKKVDFGGLNKTGYWSTRASTSIPTPAHETSSPLIHVMS